MATSASPAARLTSAAVVVIRRSIPGCRAPKSASRGTSQVSAKNGVAQPGFQKFLALVNDGSKRCWVKLTGIYRFSQAPHYADVKPFAQALIALAPDRLIWGSDFPQLSFADKVGTIELYNHLVEWAPDAAMRARILADNPARLFGFGKGAIP